MGVMVLFQLHFMRNACFRVRMAPGRGHLYHIDTFLVVYFVMTQKGFLQNAVRRWSNRILMISLSSWWLRCVFMFPVLLRLISECRGMLFRHRVHNMFPVVQGSAYQSPCLVNKCKWLRGKLTYGLYCVTGERKHFEQSALVYMHAG